MINNGSLKGDFKKITWAKIKDVFTGIKDVLIFSFIVGGLCILVDFISSFIIKGIGG